MKTSFLFLGLCCALAAISCTSIDDSASATKPLTITLTKDDSATKTTFAADGTGLTRVWKEGDAVSVLYIVSDTEYYNEKFILSAGAGTTKGTFMCASSHIPTTGTANVKILYPYTEDSVYEYFLTRSLANQGNGSLDNLGNYDWMSVKGTFTDGVFSATSLESEVSFLKIPKGTKLLADENDATTINLTLSEGNNYLSTSIHNSYISYESSTITAGSVTLTGIALSEKKTVSDIYIAISCMSGKSDYRFTFTVKKDDTLLSEITMTRATSIERAHVYTIPSTNFIN